ncbi:unnamed protein product, partial [Mesocestoides corti]
MECDALLELLPDLAANLISLYLIAPDHAKEALSNVFVLRRDQLEGSLRQLFFLPNLPGLEEFQPILSTVCPWRDLCLPGAPYPDPSELQLAPPDNFADLLTAWLSALSHSSRPVRRICLASLVANAG